MACATVRKMSSAVEIAQEGASLLLLALNSRLLQSLNAAHVPLEIGCVRCCRMEGSMNIALEEASLVLALSRLLQESYLT